MKKLWISLFIIAVMPLSAMAKSIRVEALSDFTTENPPKYMQVKAVTDLQLNDKIILMPDYILKGEIVGVKDPTRLKRDATFSFVLKSYVDKSGKEHSIEENIIGKYTTQFDTAGMAKSAALSVGDHFFKGISAGFTVIEGAVKNEEGNRVKSSAVALYKSSPLSYVETGHQIIISKNEIFILNFKTKEEEKIQEPNYQFTPIENPAINTTEQPNHSLPENPSANF